MLNEAADKRISRRPHLKSPSSVSISPDKSDIAQTDVDRKENKIESSESTFCISVKQKKHSNFHDKICICILFLSFLLGGGNCDVNIIWTKFSVMYVNHTIDNYFHKLHLINNHRKTCASGLLSSHDEFVFLRRPFFSRRYIAIFYNHRNTSLC